MLGDAMVVPKGWIGGQRGRLEEMTSRATVLVLDTKASLVVVLETAAVLTTWMCMLESMTMAPVCVLDTTTTPICVLVDDGAMMEAKVYLVCAMEATTAALTGFEAAEAGVVRDRREPAAAATIWDG